MSSSTPSRRDMLRATDPRWFLAPALLVVLAVALLLLWPVTEGPRAASSEAYAQTLQAQPPAAGASASEAPDAGSGLPPPQVSDDEPPTIQAPTF